MGPGSAGQGHPFVDRGEAFGGFPAPFEQKQRRIVAGDATSFEHERPGEKPHRLLNRIPVCADLLDKVPQPCLAEHPAAGSVLPR